MTLLREYRAFEVRNKVQGEMVPTIEDIVLEVLSPSSLIKRQDLVIRVENRVRNLIGSNTLDDSISGAVSNCLNKLAGEGKADNPSTGLWKLI